MSVDSRTSKTGGFDLKQVYKKVCDLLMVSYSCQVTYSRILWSVLHIVKFIRSNIWSGKNLLYFLNEYSAL